MLANVACGDSFSGPADNRPSSDGGNSAAGGGGVASTGRFCCCSWLAG